MIMANPIAELLIDLKIIDQSSVKPYANKVRDRDDIQAMRCDRSGVIFLSDAGLPPDYYQHKTDVNVTTVAGVVMTPAGIDDNARRAGLYASRVAGRRWLDVGSGCGGLLDHLACKAAKAAGVEPNAAQRAAAVARGHAVFPSVDELEGQVFDVISLFHVLEHLTDPVGMLRRLGDLLADGGLLIVEVPHARDVLLETFDCDAFRDFTLWSEHLVLHTRNSLQAVLRAGGWVQTTIIGQQRYPLSNHLRWLRHGAPGGHEAWGFLDSPELERAYEARLAALDQTDTLTAFARR